MTRWRAPSLRRLRPRLIATLALVAAATALAVAGASYAVVRAVRLDRETDEALEQSRFNLVSAADALPPGATTAELEGVLRSLQRRGGFDTVIVAGDRSFQSSVSFGPSAVPADLAEAVADGRIVAARRTIAGRDQILVGGVLQPDGPTLWFSYPLAEVHADLRTLALALAASAAAMVALSAGIGVLAAGGLLRPIAQARDAARRIQHGDLEVRLDTEGSDEFAELSRSFNAMTAALQRTVTELRTSEARQRRFSSDVSHELRTPVTALAAAADVLEPRLGALSGTELRAARILVHEAGRLRHLIDDLMEISRLDAGVAVLEPAALDLGSLLRMVAGQPAFAGSVVLRGDDVTVEGDRRRLHRVFANLIDNALRHGQPPVEVTVQHGGEVVVVDVDDHGPGIPAEHRAHVFDRFYKADQARARTTSSGLGLAIAHEDVLLHGGTIEAGDRPGGGARFRVTLPLALSSPVVADPLPGGDPVVTAGTEPGGVPNPATKEP